MVKLSLKGWYHSSDLNTHMILTSQILTFHRLSCLSTFYQGMYREPSSFQSLPAERDIQADQSGFPGKMSDVVLPRKSS